MDGKETSLLGRRMFVKIHRDHMSQVTLDEHGVPWEWDEVRSPSLFILEAYVMADNLNNVRSDSYHCKALNLRV